MSRHGLSRPPGAIVRSLAIGHESWLAGHLTGAIELRLATLTDRFVSPGTGRLVLGETAGRDIVAEKAARSRDQPILPGSGIKGAVRTLYELLSHSCNPLDSGSCCKGLRVCDACSIFGARGYLGRVSFSDAVPQPEGSVTITVRQLPIGHESKGSRTQGEFRLYDLAPEPRQMAGSNPRATHAREVFQGRFHSRLSFTNLTTEELGRLLLCLGLGEGEANGFPLRLGGVKYDGLGGVRVTVEALSLRSPEREEVRDADRARRTAGWIVAALSSAWGAAFRATYSELSKTLRIGEGVR